MTELSVLERVRAAVAEAGYDPTLILESTEPDDFLWQADMVALPGEVVWRAREAVHCPDAICRRCFTEPHWPSETACLADRRFVEDCGRDRSEP